MKYSEIEEQILDHGEENIFDEEKEYCKCETEESKKKTDRWEDFWETEEGRCTKFWETSYEEWKTLEEEKRQRRVPPRKMKSLRKEEWRMTQTWELISTGSISVSEGGVLPFI